MEFQNLSANGSSFCKIISCNFDKMKVPSKFVEEGLGNEIALYHNAILHGPANQIWKVKLLKTEDDKLYLTDGLRKFIEENSIKNNEMLHFNHRGNMCFDVSVLAVMMPATVHNSLVPCQQLEDNPCQVGIDHASLIEKSNSPYAADNGSIEVCLQDEKRKRGRPRKDRSMIHHSRSSRLSTGKQVRGSNKAPNLKQKREYNPDEAHHGSSNEESHRTHADDGILIEACVHGEKRKRGRPRKYRSMIDLLTSSPPSTKKPVRGNNKAPNPKRKQQCNPDEVKVVTNINTEVKFISKFPFFQCRLAKDLKQKFMLNIPKEFFVKHMSHSISIILRNSEKKCWMVSVVPLGKGHAFSEGFKAFFLQNKLEIGDTCVFELVEDNIMEFYVLH